MRRPLVTRRAVVIEQNEAWHSRYSIRLRRAEIGTRAGSGRQNLEAGLVLRRRPAHRGDACSRAGVRTLCSAVTAYFYQSSFADGQFAAQSHERTSIWQ